MRCILQFNSAGEFVIVNPFDIPAGSHQNPLADDPFWTANIVRSLPAHGARSLWNRDGCIDAPISYTVPLNHFTGTTTFTATSAR
jgi:hypothetical protein